MKTFKEMYPDTEADDYFYAPSGYQPILDAIGEIVVQEDEDDYQGDSRVLYKRGEEYGYLQFGWGSCSGCDALQACDSPEEVETLGKSLEESVKWDTREGMLKFFQEHDWKGDYSSDSEECKTFRGKAVAVLEAV